MSFKEEFLSVLLNKLISINHFPNEYKSYQVVADDAEMEHDTLISRYATRLAIEYIDRKTPMSQEEIDQFNCLKLYLMYRDVFGAQKYISTKELMSHLLVGRGKPINEQQFRSTVIGKLRDQ